MSRNHLLEIVGAAISRDPHIDIAVGGDTAYCAQDEAGRTKIVLPDLGEEKLPETLGYLWHEAGHARFTPKDLSLNNDSMLQGVWNALEDPRMEARVVESYPGASSRLGAVVKHVFHDSAQCGRATGPLDVVMWLNLRLRAEKLFQPVSGKLLAKVEKNAKSAVGNTIADQAWGIALQAFADLDGTTVPERAKEILALLSPAEENQQGGQKSSDAQDQSGQSEGQEGNQNQSQSQSPENNDGDGDGNGDDPSGPDKDKDGASGKSSKSNTDDDDADQSSSSSDQDVDEEEGEPSQNQRGGSKSRSKPLNADALKNVSLGDILQDALKAPKGKGQQKTSTPSGPLNRLIPVDVSGRHVYASEITGEDIVGMANSLSGLKQKLAELIQSRKEKPVAPKMTGNRLLPRRLHKAATPEPTIWGTRQNVKAVNTALQVLVDLSGSMSDAASSWSKAQAVAYAMAKALQGKTGVAVKVDAYGYFHIIPIMGWGERPNSERFRVSPSGGTPTGNAIFTVLPDLLGRKEAKKILVVITDGDPDDKASTSRMITTAREGGVIVLGIGICVDAHDAVRSLFGEHAVLVNSIEDLPKALGSVLRQVL